jgi:antitoxin component HigA of HigAB toxin-antitoxin module
MEIKPIRDEQAYREALREIALLMETDPALGTPEGDRLDVLSTLVEAYEARSTESYVEAGIGDATMKKTGPVRGA